MIVLEGVDGSGKSTLAMDLEGRFGIPVVHSLGPKSKEATLKWILRSHIVQMSGCTLIYDRHPLISEMVYGKVLRGEPLIDPTTYANFLSIWAIRKPLIIYCRPPFKAIKLDKPQMEGVGENLKQLVERYDVVMLDVFKKIQCPHVIYDYTSSNVQTVYAEVENYLLKREGWWAPIEASEPGQGQEDK